MNAAILVIITESNEKKKPVLTTQMKINLYFLRIHLHHAHGCSAEFVDFSVNLWKML